MKKHFFPLLSILLVVVIGSCKKENVVTPKTKTELITAKTWVYDEYLREYNSSSAILYYKKGKTSNLIDLSKNKVTFKPDGTYTEINEAGNTLNGTWSFRNGETQIVVVNSVGTYTSNIVLLNDNQFQWLDPTTSNGTLGRMIPQ